MDEKSSQAGRRDFLKKAAIVSGGLILSSQLTGCGKPEEPEMLVGSLADLKAKGQLSPKFNDNRLFCTLRGEEIVIFNLTCRHKKCTVKWEPGVREFHCPCHEGKYNSEGKVVGGPPPGPLFRFKHEIRNEDEIWVLNEYEV